VSPPIIAGCLGIGLENGETSPWISKSHVTRPAATVARVHGVCGFRADSDKLFHLYKTKQKSCQEMPFISVMYSLRWSYYNNSRGNLLSKHKELQISHAIRQKLRQRLFCIKLNK